MNKTELNMDIINKVIAFKMLEILRNNGIVIQKWAKPKLQKSKSETQ